MVEEFKVGDKVKRINGEHMGMKVGDIAIITETTSGNFSISLCSYDGGHAKNNFVKIYTLKQMLEEAL